MFNTLNERLTHTIKKIRGQARLTEKNIQDTLRDIRKSLFDADVALPAVKDFIAQIKRQVIGRKIHTRLAPGQALTKIVNEQLVSLLGQDNAALNLNTQPPAIILILGLQGSGKTTSAAKLARFIKERHNKQVLLVSTDVYRPAAIDQLKKLAEEIEVDFLNVSVTQNPTTIVQEALTHSKHQYYNVVIIDTAGRLHIDLKMMAEIKTLHQIANPIETLLVVDSMTGQDAVNTASGFNNAVKLTGIILTKIDGDARGGAALSIKHVTGTPIKFIGVGEKTDALEAFYPDRVASRILGMGDVVSLVEEVERTLDKDKTKKLVKKLEKGKGFNLQDFQEQIMQMDKMGGIMGMMSKLPMMNSVPNAMKSQLENKQMTGIVNIINSMTVRERYQPKIIAGSRKRRIAKGAGVQIQEVNRLLKHFYQMQKMIKKIKSPGAMKKFMRNMDSSLL